jgi:hypothetical protein
MRAVEENTRSFEIGSLISPMYPAANVRPQTQATPVHGVAYFWEGWFAIAGVYQTSLTLHRSVWFVRFL